MTDGAAMLGLHSAELSASADVVRAELEAGDASLSLMFVKLFGEQAGALPNVIAFIAVLGGANGMVLATLRMPDVYKRQVHKHHLGD